MALGPLGAVIAFGYLGLAAVERNTDAGRSSEANWEIQCFAEARQGGWHLCFRSSPEAQGHPHKVTKYEAKVPGDKFDDVRSLSSTQSSL